MNYIIKVKIIVLLLSIMFLASSCEVYCVLSDTAGGVCSDVLRKANERRDKRYEKEKEREHRKKMEEINKTKNKFIVNYRYIVNNLLQYFNIY